MHLTAFRVLYFVAACGSSSSKFVFYCGFLLNLPHDISQSMRKRKYEFAHDVIANAWLMFRLFTIERDAARETFEFGSRQLKKACEMRGMATYSLATLCIIKSCP